MFFPVFVLSFMLPLGQVVIVNENWFSAPTWLNKGLIIISNVGRCVFVVLWVCYLISSNTLINSRFSFHREGDKNQHVGGMRSFPSLTIDTHFKMYTHEPQAEVLQIHTHTHTHTLTHARRHTAEGSCLLQRGTWQKWLTVKNQTQTTRKIDQQLFLLFT